jgi:hypothetical protein
MKFPTQSVQHSILNIHIILWKPGLYVPEAAVPVAVVVGIAGRYDHPRLLYNVSTAVLSQGEQVVFDQSRAGGGQSC